MNSEIITNPQFIKNFLRFLIIGLSVILLGLMGQVGVLGQVWQRGAQLAQAINAGDCENGWTFLGGDAGDNNSWVQGCAGGVETAGAQAGKKDDQGEKKEDQGEKKEDQAEKKEDQGVAKQDQAAAKQDQGVTKQDQGAGKQDQGVSSCTPDGQISTTSHCQSGTTQMCTYNIWRGSSCNTGEGGPYNCHDDASCGFKTQGAPTVTNTNTTSTNTATQLSCFICDANRPAGSQRRAFAGTFTSCEGVNGGAGKPSTDSSESICQAPPQGSTGGGSTGGGGNSGGGGGGGGGTATACQTGQTGTIRLSDGSILNCNAAAGGGGGGGGSGGSVTGSGNSTVTVNLPGGGKEVIREVRVAGVQTVAAAPVQPQVLSEVKVLPKTGLPLLAWGLAGLLPIGFKVRRFSREKHSQASVGHYLWQEREFLKG